MIITHHFLGDSLNEIGKGSGAPTKFILLLQAWLKLGFGKSFKNQRNILPHAVQEDTYSCSIITINTIAHAVLDKPLWRTEQAVAERLSWFVRLASGQNTFKMTKGLENLYQLDIGPTIHSNSDAPQCRAGLRLAISELLNPLPTSLLQPEHPNYTFESFESETDSDSACAKNRDDSVSIACTTANTESDYAASRLCEHNSTLTFNQEDEQENHVDQIHTEPAEARFKRLREDSSDFDSDSSYLSDGPAKKNIRAGEGTSKSAVKSRLLRQKLADGTFKIDPEKYRKCPGDRSRC
jgi:hypothetical protein